MTNIGLLGIVGLFAANYVEGTDTYKNESSEQKRTLYKYGAAFGAAYFFHKYIEKKKD